MQWMQKQTHGAREKEFLRTRHFLDIFYCVWKRTFRKVIKIAVKLMEEENVQTPEPIPLIEAECSSLLLQPIKALQIAAVYRRLERKAH